MRIAQDALYGQDVRNGELHKSAAEIAKGGRRASYMVLCYARMRTRMSEGPWFTRDDYYRFQVRNIAMSSIRDYTRRLASRGLLEKNHETGEFRITQDGLFVIQAATMRLRAVDTPRGNRDREKRLIRQEMDIGVSDEDDWS